MSDLACNDCPFNQIASEKRGYSGCELEDMPIDVNNEPVLASPDAYTKCRAYTCLESGIPAAALAKVEHEYDPSETKPIFITHNGETIEVLPYGTEEKPDGRYIEAGEKSRMFVEYNGKLYMQSTRTSALINKTMPFFRAEHSGENTLDMDIDLGDDAEEVL